MTGGDNLSDIVEVAGAHFVLMLGRAVSMLFGRETGQGNELEFVAHRPQFTLKLCDTSAIEMQDYHFLYWSKKESRSITCPNFRKNVKIEEGSRAFDECSGLVQRAFIRNGSRSLGTA